METQATPGHTQQSACAPADPSALRGEHRRTPRTSRVPCVTPAAAPSDGVQRTSITSQQLRGRAEWGDVPGATLFNALPSNRRVQRAMWLAKMRLWLAENVLGIRFRRVACSGVPSWYPFQVPPRFTGEFQLSTSGCGCS
jgi:hypothetical protein